MVLVTVFTLVALFSIISIVMSTEDTARSDEPKESPLFWATLGRR
jgi:hypothetical protein